MGVAQMDDGGRRCALPGCDRVIPSSDGRPERRYCTAAHRAAARQARRAAAQQQGRPDLPWLPEVEPAGTDPAPAAARPAPAARPPGRRTLRPGGRALAMLGVAGILAGGYAATDALPGPSPSPVQATPEGQTADGWAQRATVTLASVNRELDVLAQAEEEWRGLPGSSRTVVPAPVAALEERRSVLQQRRATLQSQLDAYRSLRQVQEELAVSEQHLRAVETMLADVPPEQGRSPEQEAAIAALNEQRDLRLRRRDAQRAELASLQDGVAAAVRTPMPDDGEVTAKVTRDVREMVRRGGTPPTEPQTAPAPVTPAPDARPTDDRATLAELWQRAQEVARQAREAEAAGRLGRAADDDADDDADK
jgi:hypothetical protein